MSVTAAQTLQRAYDNYARIWLLVTEIITTQVSGQQLTQEAIDGCVAVAEGAGIVRPKITYSADGESYDWTGYQAQLGKIMTDLREQMILAAGPFEVWSRARY